MIFTKEFNKAIRWYFLLSVLLISSYQVVPLVGVEFNMEGKHSPGRIVYEVLWRATDAISFWYVLYYLTKDKVSSLAAGGFYLLTTIAIYYSATYSNSNNNSINLFLSSWWYDVTSYILATALFGWLHFKKYMGLWLGIVGFITIMSGPWSYPFYYVEFLKNIGLDELLEDSTFRIALSKGGYGLIQPLQILLNSLKLLTSIILIWFGIKVMEQSKRFDFHLRTLHLNDSSDIVARSLVHWNLRIFLISSIFSLHPLIPTYYREGLSLKGALTFIGFSVAIYILGSLYPNNLTIDFVRRGKFPSWSYLLLNIPVIHFIFWLRLMFEKEKEDFTHSDYITQHQTVELYKAKFLKNYRNLDIVVLSIILFILLNLVRLSGSTNTEEIGAFFIAVLLYIPILIWMFQRQYGMYILYPFFVVFFLPSSPIILKVS